MPNSKPKLTKVLYIAGEARSGSTLLELLLERTVPSTFAAGELIYVWKNAFVENYLCGCGRPLQQCDFWTAVVQQAFGGWQSLDAQRIVNFLDSIGRIRNAATTSLRMAVHQPSLRAELRELSAVWDALYTAIQTVSGCQVVIDSSKIPAGCLILDGIGSVDTYFLQLVRDSRGVAYSLQRKKPMPEVTRRVEYMARFNPLAAALRWDIVNLLISRHTKGKPLYKLVHYRELVARPQAIVGEIAAFIGAPADFSAWTGERVIELGENHTLAGNPGRFKHGRVEIRSDDEWREKMPRTHRWLVTAITAPLLWRYGYFRRGSER